MRLQLLPSDKVRADATRGSVSKGVARVNTARVDASLRDTTQGAASVSLKSLFLRHMIFFVLLQGYLTTSNIYIITLIKMSFHIDVVAYSQTFYYITSLISLAVYFLSKRKQLLQDKLSQTMLYEIEPVKEPHNLSSFQKHANALKMP